MSRILDLNKTASATSAKKINRPRSFHLHYLELCRSKNTPPLSDVHARTQDNSILDFFGDRIAYNDWRLITQSLYHDQALKKVAIKLRKNNNQVVENIDTDRKAILYKLKPVVFTKFVFSGLVEAITNCITNNNNLQSLRLEGLPLSKSMSLIATALNLNESIKDLSFQRSLIDDEGCQIICNAIKYQMNIENLNLAECGISVIGAGHVADMIRVQKVNRYSDSWQQSLRYRSVDSDSIPGLRTISLARNPDIGDNGVKDILEILKEDCWIKSVDMASCGLTDQAASGILECIQQNRNIADFIIDGNAKISSSLTRSIHQTLNKLEANTAAAGDLNRPTKGSVPLLLSKIKTLQLDLDFERSMRKKADGMNTKLADQLMDYEKQLECKQAIMNGIIPPGHILVTCESLESLINERNEYEQNFKTLEAITGRNLDQELNERKNLEELPECEQSDNSLVKGSARKPISISVKKAREFVRNLDGDSEDELTTYNAANNLAQYSNVEEDTVFNIKRVRKIKSEVKYIEAKKNASKNKKSKSDHGISNEIRYRLAPVKIETGIGDVVDIVAVPITASTEQFDSSCCSTLRGEILTDDATVRYRKQSLQDSMQTLMKSSSENSVNGGISKEAAAGRNASFNESAGLDDVSEYCSTLRGPVQNDTSTLCNTNRNYSMKFLAENCPNLMAASKMYGYGDGGGDGNCGDEIAAPRKTKRNEQMMFDEQSCEEQVNESAGLDDVSVCSTLRGSVQNDASTLCDTNRNYSMIFQTEARSKSISTSQKCGRGDGRGDGNFGDETAATRKPKRNEQMMFREPSCGKLDKGSDKSDDYARETLRGSLKSDNATLCDTNRTCPMIFLTEVRPGSNKQGSGKGNGNGKGRGDIKKSPRSLFLGN